MARKKYDENGNYISERDIGKGDWQQIAYENLANAVVRLACEDYIRAWKLKGNTWDGFREGGQTISAKGLEKWFRSQEFSTFTSLDGEYLVTNLQRRLEHEKYLKGGYK